MTREEKLAIIEEIMELDEGTLKEDSKLDDFEEWDSMTKLSIVAESKKIFDREITGADLKSCTILKDLLDL